MSIYRRDLYGTKYRSFFVKDDELLEKYNEICKNVENTIKKEFESEPIYNDKYLKAKLKSFNGKINKNFNKYKIPKEGAQLICLSVILINFVFRTVLKCF